MPKSTAVSIITDCLIFGHKSWKTTTSLELKNVIKILLTFFAKLLNYKNELQKQLISTIELEFGLTGHVSTNHRTAIQFILHQWVFDWLKYGGSAIFYITLVAVLV